MDQLDNLINTYRNGDSQAAEQLLVKLAPLISMYTRFIKYGGADFNRSPNLAKFLKALRHPNGSKGAISWLRNQGRRYSIEEIEQEVKISILECAYNKGKIIGWIHYILAKNIKELMGGWMETEAFHSEPTNKKGILNSLLDQVELNPDEDELLKIYLDSGLDSEYTSRKLGVNLNQFYYRLRKIKEKCQKN